MDSHVGNAGHQKLMFITTLRGMACLIIIFEHVFMGGIKKLNDTWSYFPDMNYDNRYLIQPYISSFIATFDFSFPAYGVALFFLITGFTTLLSLSENSNSKYLVKRVFRIYPTYIASFSITVLSVYIYCRYRNVSFPYTLKDYLCHISMFRNWLWSPYIDQGVWTLELNMDFYIFIFFAYKLLRGGEQKKVNIVAIVLGVIQIGVFVASNNVIVGTVLWCRLYTLLKVIPYIVFQLIGFTICNHFFNKISVLELCKSIVVLLGIFIVTCYFSIENTVNIASYIYGIVTFLGFYAARGELRNAKILNGIAIISYPLYVMHGLIGYIILAILNAYSSDFYLSFIVAVSIPMILATIIHVTVEKTSIRLYKRLFG